MSPCRLGRMRAICTFLRRTVEIPSIATSVSGTANNPMIAGMKGMPAIKAS